MKRIPTIALNTVLVIMLLAGCKKSSPAPESIEKSSEVTNIFVNGDRTGTVTEVINSGGYTYVLVDDGEEEFWAAAPEFAVSVGDTVVITAGMPMHNYHSKSLDRDFDVVYFEEKISVGAAGDTEGPEAPLPQDHPAPVKAEAIDIHDIPVAEDGVTIAEIFARKTDLAGQKVVVRGKVVKFNPAIMGTNWLHLQDGTGEEGTNDLTVTTDASVNVDDIVVIEGVVRIDRDLGSGYFYPVIIENAKVTLE